MRFMIMHKVTEEMERGDKPSDAIIAGVGKLIAEGLKDGVFVAGEGLKPTSQRSHLAYRGGKRTITDGPFTEAKELVGGFALMRVKSKEDAIGWCDKFAAVLGDVELFLGPVVEPWDLGLTPKAAGAPLRYLAMHKAVEAGDCDLPPDPVLNQKMGVLIAEMTKAGVLQSTGGLASTKLGARVHYEGGKKQKVVDGPFAESKELVAGFSILNLPSRAEAIDWATRLAEIIHVKEIEVRQMPEW